MSQQRAFLEAIVGIKKALKRKAYESDSDDSIEHNGNRGQKLKKRARFTRQGQLAPPSGPEVYKEEIEYAGARRDILSRNPPLIDDGGYEVDSEDEESRVQDAIANAAELNPYSSIRLEHILAPLTSVTDLATHQTLSIPFTSKTLTDLANQGSELHRKEHQSLWKVKPLMTGLCGDYIWAPCALMLGPNDAELYSEDYVRRLAQQRSSGEPDGSSPATLNGDTRIESQKDVPNGKNSPVTAATEVAQPGTTNGLTNGRDVEMADAGKEPPPEKTDKDRPPEAAGGNNSNGQAEAREAHEGGVAEGEPEQNGTSADAPLKDAPDSVGKEPGTTKASDATTKPADEKPVDENVEMQDVRQPPAPIPEPQEKESHNGDRQPTATPSNDSSEFFIHPFFDIPPNARPDKDMGLPDNEADNVRHLIALYVQKQEEICRGAKKLHEGLLKADRLRKEVLKWSKAEAHCGPNRDLSDGEDWYDKDEWGLTEVLKKGQDEEEEDIGTTTKKTRNRK